MPSDDNHIQVSVTSLLLDHWACSNFPILKTWEAWRDPASLKHSMYTRGRSAAPSELYAFVHSEVARRKQKMDRCGANAESDIEMRMLSQGLLQSRYPLTPAGPIDSHRSFLGFFKKGVCSCARTPVHLSSQNSIMFVAGISQSPDHRWIICTLLNSSVPPAPPRQKKPCTRRSM